jgi:hypothetical protein
VGVGVHDVDVVECIVDGEFEGELKIAGDVEVDKGQFFVGVVFPGDGHVRVAGLVEPLVEEILQVLAADGLHGFLEIGAGGVPVAVSGIISGDAFPEEAVADRTTEHMQYPAALFIVIRVEELHVIAFNSSVDDGGEAGLFIGDDLFAVCLKAFDEGVGAVSIFQVTEGHVGGEAFAEPEVFPPAFGGCVAEPLVGYFVGHEGFDVWGAD